MRTRAIALSLVLALASSSAHADEPGTEPPSELAQDALYEEFWHLWWDKPGLGGPITWTVIGSLATVGSGGLPVSCATSSSASCGGSTVIPIIGLAAGAVILGLSILWIFRRAEERQRYDDRMDALGIELVRRGLPMPGR